MKRTPILAISCLLYSTSFLPGQGGDLDPSMLNGSLSSLGAPQRSMKAISQVDPGTPLPTLDGGALSTFPLTITEPGYYYLTQNVTLDPAVSGAAITIAASAPDVTLDLRGFQIVGTGGTGTLDSQSAIRVSADRATIRNGNITGTWYAGVFSDKATTTCANLNVTGSNVYGIHTGDNARLDNCTVDGTVSSGFITTRGFLIGDSSRLQDCSALSCDAIGFETGAYNHMIGCLSYSNAGSGFIPGHYSRFNRCLSMDNTGAGYTGQFVGTPIYVDCAAVLNDFEGWFVAGDQYLRCSANLNGGRGFYVSGTVDRCNAAFNDSSGFELSGSSTVSHCIATFNDADGFVVSSGRRNALFTNCISRSNGSTAGNTSADGFQLSSVCQLIDSIADSNRGFGVRTTDDPNFIRGNFIYGNSGGGFMLGGAATTNLVIGNLSTSHSSGNYSHSGGNIGPIESAALGTSPHANFQ